MMKLQRIAWGLALACVIGGGVLLVSRLTPAPGSAPNTSSLSSAMHRAQPSPHVGTSPTLTAPGGGIASATSAPSALVRAFTAPPVPVREEQLAPRHLQRISLVRAAFKYPLWRLEETFVENPQAAGWVRVREVAMVADHILVRLQPGVSEERLEALNRRWGGHIRRCLSAPYHYLVAFAEADADTVPRMAARYREASEVVRHAEPDYIVHTADTFPNDPQWDGLWGLHNTGQTGGTPDADIDAPEAWDISTGNTNIVVAVIDTGVDYNHADLAANMWTNPGEIPGNGVDDDGNGFVDDIHGWDFYNGDADPMDDNSHGTHCAGTIGAVGNNGLGVVGVNWRVRIVALKFLGGSGYGDTADAIDALNYVLTLRQRGVNIRLTSNSWGGGGASQQLQDAIAAQGAAGLLFIAAAGNSGLNNDLYPFYPSSFALDNIIAVAATGTSDNRASFSNYGVTTVDLGAPGVDILSTMPGGSYATKSGTSMATPHVSGVAALLWSLASELDPLAVKNAILAATDPVSSLFLVTVTGGRLNAHRTLLTLAPTIVHTPLENTAETNLPYVVDAFITPRGVLNTNALWVYWNTNGAPADFFSNLMVAVSNDLYRGLIPAQPLDTVVHYWLEAVSATNLVSRHPTNAPDAMHTFRVVVPLPLLVQGAPTNYGVVNPDYGLNQFPSGKVLTASATPFTAPEDGTRHACTGWTGDGSVPPAGTTTAVTFTLAEPSTLEWQWTLQYALTQTSQPAGLWSTTTWWHADSTGQTVSAPQTITRDCTNYAFAYWLLDGMRQPDGSSEAVNPVPDIMMSSPRVAEAVYFPEDQDHDADGLPDWWEYFYFGNATGGPDDDNDLDGVTSRDEYADRTSPRRSDSVPAPPVIVHTPLADPQSAPAPFLVSAVVTDNFTVAGVWLRWSRAGDPPGEAAMTRLGTPDVYQAAIPAPGTNGDVFTYSMVATDPAGHTATNGPHTFLVAYPVLSVSPSDLLTNLLTPESTTRRELSVSNAGNANLNFTAELVTVGFSDDVESGTNGWTHGGWNDLWNIAAVRSHSGDHAWYCGNTNTGYYTNSMHATLDSPPITLGPAARLTFWQWLVCELDLRSGRGGWAWDGGIVEISTNGGLTFAQIEPVGGYPYRISGWSEAPWPEGTPCFAAGTGIWTRTEFDLSAYDGREVVLRFHFGTDSNTEREGWYLDDIVVGPLSTTNQWLTLTTTTGQLAAATATNLALTLTASNIPTGDRATWLRLRSNAPYSPITNVPVAIQVRSPPAAGFLQAGQSSTNGEGLVTVVLAGTDADGETCDVQIEFSVDHGETWTPAWLGSALAACGAVTLTNATAGQIAGWLTTSNESPVTNLLTATWLTTNHLAPVTLSTATLVRARLWDGLWESVVTSQPFLVDNEPPTKPGSFSSPTHLPATWSTNAVLGITWAAATDGAGAGVARYEYGFTTAPENPAACFASTTGTQAASAPLADGTSWWACVRAVDHMGNRSASASTGAYWIDATPPSAAAATVTLAHSPFGLYIVGSNELSAAWTGFADAASGIAGYYVSLTNAAGTEAGTWTTATTARVPDAQWDTTNTVYVWARDHAGGIGAAASSALLVLSADGDWDGDGLLNAQEETAGTDAASAASVFAFSAAESAPDTTNAVVLQWQGITNRLYSLYQRDTALLGTSVWQVVPEAKNLPGVNGIMVYTDRTATVPQRFYKITVDRPAP